MLDLEDVIEPKLVGELDLIEHLLVDAMLSIGIPLVLSAGLGN